MVRLANTVPREQVGPATGAAYEFQYAEAALACLELLSDASAACVYCEWHDDFVVERDGGTAYEFFQVKQRSQSEGPWPLSAILGVAGQRPLPVIPAATPAPSKPKPKAKPKPLRSAAAIGVGERLLEHQRNFTDACAVFTFVSTHDVTTDDAFYALVSAARAAHRQTCGIRCLPQEMQELFAEILAAYQTRNAATTADELWGLLGRLHFVRAKGRPDTPSVAIGLMGQRILELSEVDLLASEQQRVATQLINLVRAQSHRVLETQPLPSEADVRCAKTVGIEEVLLLLALSPEGFRELKSRGRDAVVTLSRLHRLCRDSGLDEQSIQRFCELKVKWDTWLSDHRDSITGDAIALVEAEASLLLRQLRASTSKTKYHDLHADAVVATERLIQGNGVPPDLTVAHLIGLVFATAARSEKRHG